MKHRSEPVPIKIQFIFPTYVIVDGAGIVADADGSVTSIKPDARFYFVNVKIGPDQKEARCVPLFSNSEHAHQLGQSYKFPNATLLSIPSAEDLISFLEHQDNLKGDKPDFVALYPEKEVGNGDPAPVIRLKDLIHAIKNTLPK